MLLRSIHKLLIVTCLLVSVNTYAQDSVSLSVIVNVKRDTIQLRWAVNSPLAWKWANQFGYRIERYTIVRNNIILPTAEKVVLLPVIKPSPLDSWEFLAKSNNYAAVIAQALYGSKFQLSGDDAKGVSKLIALAQELEQRYMISMYAADMCYPAAKLAGWGYDDTTAKLGERYLYRIIPLIPGKTLNVGMGSAYVSLDEYQPLPQPQELTGVFGNKSVMLTWNFGILDKTYISYHIEKSFDGKTFSRITDIPLVNMNSRDGKPSERMFYIDSIANNSVQVHYRILGVTSFGEIGPPSDIVSGTGVDNLIFVPHIHRAVPNERNEVEIEWEFDVNGNNAIKCFELRQSNNDKGPFKVVKKNISSNSRRLIYDSLLVTNYFVIAAISHQGEEKLSYPVLVQPIDTIPPAIPTGLKGVVDSVGLVKLSWNNNTDKDILGYRIYRAQNSQEELIPLTDVAIKDNSYYDTIEVRNLNRKVYYAVAALDQRYNQSPPSIIAELKKPDLVPPSPPIITDYRVTREGVHLRWVTGNEEGIRSVKLIRREQNNSDANKYERLLDFAVTAFFDSTVIAGRIYDYTIVSLSESGLASAPSPKITVRTLMGIGIDKQTLSISAKFSYRYQRVEVSWDSKLPDVKSFEVFKCKKGKPMVLWKTFKGYDHYAVDLEVTNKSEYEYMIRAVSANGKYCGVSKVSVTIK